MGELNELRIEVKQTNQQKYETIRPFFERLNLYCDAVSLRFERDKDLFAIPLSSIKCAEYKEDTDILFILFNNTHTIFIIKEKHNCIIQPLITLYNSIKRLIINNQKQNS